jgi:hypothetical protein
MTTNDGGPAFPRYFTHTQGFTSDALYVRCDSECDLSIITVDGSERIPNHPFGLSECLLMVLMGEGEEITNELADAMLKARQQ